MRAVLIVYVWKTISDLTWPASDFLYRILLTPVFRILAFLGSHVSEARFISRVIPVIAFARDLHRRYKLCGKYVSSHHHVPREAERYL